MTTGAEVRPLTVDDDRTVVRCGDAPLDRFFHHHAGQNQFKLHLAMTYIAPVADHLVGFDTVTVGSVERSPVPSGRLRRKMPGTPLPILRLARLGVDEKAQGAGIGRGLVRHVLGLALAQRDSVGCFGVVTDAKPNATSFTERYGLEPLEGVKDGLLSGNLTPMFLTMSTIVKAPPG